MIQRQLYKKLDLVGRRYRRLRVWTSLMVVYLLAAILGSGLLWASLRSAQPLIWVPVILALGTVAVAAILGWYVSRQTKDRHWIAKQLEAAYPDLNARLLAAVEQEPELSMGRLGFLQESVIREALSHDRRNNWLSTAPVSRLLAVWATHLVAFASLACVLISLVHVSRSKAIADSRLPRVYIDAGSNVAFDVTVDPGDVEWERGRSLLVLARFDRAVPPDATLVFQGDAGEQQIDMSRSLEDPVFVARIPAVGENLTYRVRYAEQQSEAFQVTVFEYPELQRADARLVFPDYTSLEPRTVEDTRQVTAVEGTELTLTCRLNKPVAMAQLVADDGEVIELSARSDQPTHYATTMHLSESRRFRLHLTDDRQRQNKQPPQFVVNVTRNKPPELKLTWPARDVQASPLEELQLGAEVWDDFGIESYGVSYGIGGNAPRDLVLGERIAARTRHDIQHLLEMESLQVAPDELVSYFFWVEDTRPDGRTRRTFSDMYFAEIRPFEEIFRQGSPPPGGESQQQPPGENEQDAEKLAELQKQIINSTWTIIRREQGSAVSERFVEDSQLLVESQQSAIEQAAALEQKLQDPRSLEFMRDVKRHMQTAVQHLQRAVEDVAVSSHEDALPAEQAAYQSLLRLRAREHEVVQQQRQSSSSSSRAQSRQQQQLQQLELKEDENRYESEQTAASPQEEQQQREQRQVLNRLRELARRQNDLNKQLQELQSELEAAESEEEEQELRRQLKRLREQQQELLRDTDELNNRLQQPQNQQQMAEAQRQLQESRENVRQASEALEQEQLSQALTAGTRAGREFEELSEQLRRETANRFAEDLQEMRQQAQQLDQREQDLAEQLAELEQQKPQTLRDSGQREQIQEGLAAQQQSLGNLLNRMQETSQQAEESQPLLAQQLYDTLRDAQQQRLDDTLDVAQQLLQRGFPDQAREAEQGARQGINDLREGVERAAERVLGGQREGLERAQRELQQVEEQLKREIADATGTQPPDRDGSDQAAAAEPAEPGEASSPPSQSEPSAESPAGPPGQNAKSGDPTESASNQQASSSEGQENAAQSSSSENAPSAESSPGNPQNAATSPGESPSPGNSPSQSPSQTPGNSTNSPGQNDSPGPPANGAPQTSPSNSQQNSPGTQSRSQGSVSLGQFADAVNGPVQKPLTGEGFRDWSDRLRDVEELVDDPELRAEAARIRDRAREIRAEFKRHSKEPNWDLVEKLLAEPLSELRRQVAAELLRRQPENRQTPIDRDPVPDRFAEELRLYYERLGSGD